MSTTEHVDVLIVGAGLSGIGAAAQLAEAHPDRSVVVLEGRDTFGGTWDLFRYPGVRSDSDMFTFGFKWRPWPSDTALADGDLILDYLGTVAREYGVDKLIRYRHRVLGASWDSETQTWTVEVEHDGAPLTFTCDWLWGCSGYYDYDEPYDAQLPGLEQFAGQVVHPQFWPEDLDYTGKKVVVVGSGATAVTLVPAMAEDAELVTMLQRTPTYILPAPARDPLARLLGPLPQKMAFPVVRWANALKLIALFQLMQRFPKQGRAFVRKVSEAQLPDHLSYDDHFKPPYDPWDQRLCVVPDGDFFRVLRDGSATVVTDTIDTFTPTGVRLGSGEELEADIVVTATGLKVLPFGGLDLTVDGEKVDLPSTMAYKGLMLSGLPNFVYTVGYTNASWTLKADLVGDYVVRLLSHMDEHGYRSAVPIRDESVGEKPFMDLSSGYVQRALHLMPKQGDRAPWQLKQNYLVDTRTIRRGVLDDGVLQFA
jgi:cation diffusion facilitator CzcD-associated flavoprotein CzcO